MSAFIAQFAGSAVNQARASRGGAERFRVCLRGHCMMSYAVYDPPASLCTGRLFPAPNCLACELHLCYPSTISAQATMSECSMIGAHRTQLFRVKCVLMTPLDACLRLPAKCKEAVYKCPLVLYDLTLCLVQFASFESSRQDLEHKSRWLFPQGLSRPGVAPLWPG